MALPKLKKTASPLDRRRSDRQIDAWCQRATALENDILRELATTEKLIKDHAAEDLNQWEAMRIEIAGSNAVITQVSTDLAALLMVARIGRGTMTFARALKKFLLWAGSVTAAIVGIWAAILWLTGRGPFPPMGH